MSNIVELENTPKVIKYVVCPVTYIDILFPFFVFQFQVESYQPEGYNPEAPAINPPRPSFWVGPRGAPRPNQPFYLQPPRQRDLVSVPTIPDISKPQS